MIVLKTDKTLPARRANDEYLTPYPEIRAAYAHLRLAAPQFEPGRVRRWKSLQILDVGANSGRWGEVAREIWPGATITGIEQQPLPQPAAYDFWYPGSDFRGWRAEFGLEYDLVVGNPPFYCAEEMVRVALSLLSPVGHLFFLLPTEFIHGQRRNRGLYREFPLKWYLPFAGRINWEGCGSQNPRDYAMYLWEADFRGTFQGMPIEVAR